MKRLIYSTLIMSILLGGTNIDTAQASSSDLYLNYLVEMQPGITLDEVKEAAENVAIDQNRTVEDVLKQMHDELKADIEKGQKEREQSNKKYTTFGGSAGKFYLDPGTKGDIYYTDAYTGAIDIEVNHGHVGMYYMPKELVESVPKKGVRTIKTSERRVHAGAVQQSVNSVTVGERNKAVGWAYSRVGKDEYSYNFATNRTTSHTGKKNCSKLVWSAYIQYGGIDIDKDGGLGVYPRDIRDSHYTKTYKTIK
ncbi:hypothetical protein J27TS8_33590 [Robertmurraya siralis]|uniref:YycO n=1 Tax=Robertmurraya siralis TaxID=77777 RepID=A0A920BVA6_9BACI|nr:YiiX/YebB-like N1pC/P60 family cysteine hydrolase [Robertmurraya siralis]PAE18513.1 hypothetical protein CHH80_21225 [Bacillus sp. 7504-2]GIN63366.1 hypothetical protein J27TS8_33590 [Robertmurraya siralis]